MEPVSIPTAGVDSPSLARRQKFNFALTAIPLLLFAWDRLIIPSDTPSAFNSVFIILLLITAAANGFMAWYYEKFRSVKARQDTTNLLLGMNGVVFLFDSIEKWMQQPRAIVYVFAFLGTLLIVRAILGSRLQITRNLTLSEKGLRVRRNLFRHVAVEWENIHSISVEPGVIVIKYRNDQKLLIHLDLIPSAAFKMNLRTMCANHDIPLEGFISF